MSDSAKEIPLPHFPFQLSSASGPEKQAPGGCLLPWRVPARQRLHLRTAKMAPAGSPMLSRNQVGVHDGAGGRACLTCQTGFLLTDQAGGGWSYRTASSLPAPLPAHLPPPHIPRIVCVFPELNPDPGSLSWDEAGVGWFLPCHPRSWGLG